MPEKFDFKNSDLQKSANKEQSIEQRKKQEAAKSELLDCLSEINNIGSYRFSEVMKKWHDQDYAIYHNLKKDLEIQAVAKERILRDLSKGHINDADWIRRAMDVPIEFTQSPEFQEIGKKIMSSNFKNAEEFMYNFNLSETILKLPEVQDIAKKQVVSYMLDNQVAMGVMHRFKVPEQFMQSAEVQDAAKKAIVRLLSGEGYEFRGKYGKALDKAIEIKNAVNMPQTVFQSSEIQEAAKKGLTECYYESRYIRSRLIRARDEIGINNEIIWDVIEKAILGNFRSYDVDVFPFTYENLEKFNFPKNRIQKIAEAEINNRISRKNIEAVFQIKNSFNISEIMDWNAFKASLLNNIGDVDYVVKILATFNTPKKIIEEIAKDGVISCLSVGNVDNAIKIKNEFKISDEILHLSEVQYAIKEGIIKYLADEKFSVVKYIQNRFELSKEIEYLPEVQNTAKKAWIKQFTKKGGYDDMNNEFSIIERMFKSRREALQSDDIQNVVRNSILEHLSRSYSYQWIIRMINDEDIKPNDEFFQSNEFRNAIKGEISSLLLKGQTDEAFQYINTSEFKLHKDILREIFDDGEAVAKYFIGKKLNLLHDHYDNYVSINEAASIDNNTSFANRRLAIKNLFNLSRAGDFDILNKFSKIIQSRSKQKDYPESKWGLDPVQEAAFYGLMQLDNPESNVALFGLLDNPDVHLTVKYAALKKLSSSKRNFLTDESREALKDWLYSKKDKAELDWQDLRFIRAILNDIPSSELREKSQKHIDVAMYDLSTGGLGANQVWQERYNQIPENIFLQLYKFCDSDDALMNKFQKLYSAIKKENTKKDNLLYGIVNALEVDPEILKMIVNKLRTIDFGEKGDADDLSELLRQIVFLNKIEEIKNSRQSYYDDEQNDEDYSNQQNIAAETDNNEIVKIFAQDVTSLKELTAPTREVVTKKIQEILPHQNMTGEKIEAIEKDWGNLEPIFTYLARYPQLKKYIAEMAVNFDNSENWKSWRYDLKNKTVKNQIGHLSKEQLDLWQNDYFVEIGDLEVSESAVDKPKRIENILMDAIMTHKHIFNPSEEQNKNEFIQKIIEDYFAAIIKEPNRKEEIYKQEESKIQNDNSIIDAIIDYSGLPRLRQGLEEIIPPGQTIKINKKTRDAIDFISKFLPKENVKEIAEKIRTLKDGDDVGEDELISLESRKTLSEKVKQIEENYAKAFESDIWDTHNLDKNNLKNLGQFYQKRQELKSAIDLLRLSNLSNRLIATNKIIEKEGKKGGEALITVIDNLKKYFKDSALLQDIKNIEFALKEKSDFGEKRKLAVIFTDNPQVMWQVGKYPLGCGSCQNYAEGSYADQLMGYVGDANCKTLYLVDLNKLPQDVKNKISENGFNEMKDGIHHQDILEASLARSIVKITKDQKGEPVVLIEPTYTVINKGDDSMDRYFNIFTGVLIAEPGNLKTARGGGNESVSKGQSRSPQGQYEDLDLGSVRFIKKTSKKTKEDLEIEERVRSSR